MRKRRERKEYDFATKMKYHDHKRRFFDCFTRRRERSHTKVAAFLGRDCPELKEVFDPLGFKRENIFCIEADEETADKIERQKLGIQVVRGEASQFFETTDHKFGIVDFDFQGHLTEDEELILALLFGRPVLSDKAVVTTNFLGKRESDDGRAYRRGLVHSEMRNIRLAASIPLLVNRDATAHAAINMTNDLLLDEVEAKPISEVRGDGLTKYLMWFMTIGRGNLEIPNWLRTILADPASPWNNNTKLVEFVKNFDAAKTVLERIRLLVTTGVYVSVLDLADTSAILSIPHFLLSEKGLVRVRPGEVYEYSMLPQVDPFMPVAIERGSYIGDNGSRMNYDLFYVKRILQESGGFCPLVRVTPSPKVDFNVELPTTPGGVSCLLQNVERMVRSFKYSDPDSKLSARVFLGSAYVPKNKGTGQKDVITREEAMMLLGANDPGTEPCTVDEILACFSGFERQELEQMETEIREAHDKRIIDSVLTTREQVNAAINQLREVHGSSLTVAIFLENYKLGEPMTINRVKALIAVDTMKRNGGTNDSTSRSPRKGQRMVDRIPPQRRQAFYQRVAAYLELHTDAETMERFKLRREDLAWIKRGITTGQITMPS